MKSNDPRLDALFAAAEEARTAEMKAALRDPGCWVEQAALVFITGMKCVAQSLVCASAALLVGADKQLALTWGVLLVLVVLPFNPRGLFWRLLFVERADKAFDEHLEQARSKVRKPVTAE